MVVITKLNAISILQGLRPRATGGAGHIPCTVLNGEKGATHWERGSWGSPTTTLRKINGLAFPEARTAGRRQNSFSPIWRKRAHNLASQPLHWCTSPHEQVAPPKPLVRSVPRGRQEQGHAPSSTSAQHEMVKGLLPFPRLLSPRFPKSLVRNLPSRPLHLWANGTHFQAVHPPFPQTASPPQDSPSPA